MVKLPLQESGICFLIEQKKKKIKKETLPNAILCIICRWISLVCDSSTSFAKHRAIFPKDTLSAGRQKSPGKTQHEQIVPRFDKCSHWKTKMERCGVGWRGKGAGKEALEIPWPWSNEHESQLRAAPTEEPLKNCRCFCLGSNLALQIFKLLLLNKK